MTLLSLVSTIGPRIRSRLEHDRAKLQSEGALAALVMVFAFGLFPYCSSYVMHHPDERHYTDGAMTMVATGDYLTPVTAEGNYRFHKPVLTYWLVAASYHLLGISPLASRLPFLWAGCGVVVLTYVVARSLYGCSRVGLYAASIMASHPILILSATRSIPDILLAFFMLISALGFMRIILRNDPRPVNYWMGYVGAGMAVATKGLPALTFVVFAFGYCLTTRPKCFVSLVSHWPSILSSFVISLAWFVAVIVRHGWVAISGFLGDQVGGRVTAEWWKPVVQYPAFLGLCAVMLAPWIVLYTLGQMRKSGRFRSAPTDSGIVQFVIPWAMFFAVFAALVTKLSSRYILLVSPLLCILLAGELCRLDRLWMERRHRSFTLALGVIFVGIAIISWHINSQIGWEVTAFAWFCLSVAVGAAVLLAGLRERTVGNVATLSMSFLILIPMGYTAIQRLAVPDQGQQIADCLLAQLRTPDTIVKIECKPALAAKVRVCSSGRLRVECVSHQQTDNTRDKDAVLVFNSERTTHPMAPPARSVQVSKGFKDLSLRLIFRGLVQGNLVELLKSQRQHYVAVLPEPQPVERVASRD